MTDAIADKPRSIETLRAIMRALRTPETGCPWDLEQDFRTIAPYTVEEAYEVADAIERGDMEDLKEELGDLQLQVVYHAQMAEESGYFAFEDVVEAINRKLVRRHPHVFGDEAARTAGAVKGMWERIKAEEKAEKARKRPPADTDDAGSVLDDVPVALPALTRAGKLQKKAARVGFDWGEAAPVLDKAEEEIAELRDALAGGDREGAAEEIGDLLFVLANLARHLGVEPEAALQAANAKFSRRFRHIETELRKQGKRPEDVGLDGMDALWDDAKRREKAV